MRRWGWAALFSFGCATQEVPEDSAQDTEDTGEVTFEPCSGAGEAAVTLGTGGRVAFVPYAEGDPLSLTENSSGARGFYLEAMAEGIDMREPVNVVYRVRIDGGASEDYLTRVGLMCDDVQGWTKSFLEFDESVNTNSLSGADFGLSVVITNDAGESTSNEISLSGSPGW